MLICSTCPPLTSLFFFNDTATTEIYTLSLHDALPICPATSPQRPRCGAGSAARASSRQPLGQKLREGRVGDALRLDRSEEHTSELQSRLHLVCRLLLEKKKTQPEHTKCV